MMTVFSLWVNGFDMMMCSASQDISRFPRRFVWAVVHVTRGPAAQWPALLVPSGAPQEMLLRAQHTSPQPERWRDTIWMYFLSIITDNIRALMNRVCPYSGVLLHDVPAEGGLLRSVGDLSGSSTGWPASRTPGRSLCPPTSAAQSQTEEEQLEDPRGHPGRSHANTQRGLLQHDRQLTGERCRKTHMT